MASKLLLIEDVDNLGRSGDVVSVKPGFARNWLLPRGFAVAANKQTLGMRDRLRKEREERAAVDKADAEKLAEQLAAVTLTTVVKVDQDGHMYGSVTVHEIADLLASQANIVVEKRAIVLKHPIKAIGVHQVPLKLKEGVVSSITVKVMEEGAQEAAETPAQK